MKHTLIVHKEKILVITLLIVAIGGWALFAITKYRAPVQKEQLQKTEPKQEIASLVAKIGSFYDLPTGEIPTVATVSDKTKLQKQAFFAKAENGDKVLIYTNAKKAILYRPSTNKIMEDAPLTFNSSPTPTGMQKNTPSAVPTQEQVIAVSIYNGTKVGGLAATTEKKLNGKYSFVNVVEKGNTIKDYSKTIVVDTNGNNTEVATSIALFLGGSVGTLPPGEKVPKGDILIIVGR